MDAAKTLALGRLHASSQFTLRQTDYRIELASVAGGALKVKDEVKVSFDLIAMPPPRQKKSPRKSPAERRIKGWSRAKKLALIRGDWERISMLAKAKGSPSTSSGRTD